MGRNAGYIALWCEIANGADGILIPEKEQFDEQDLIETILSNRLKGKKHDSWSHSERRLADS